MSKMRCRRCMWLNYDVFHDRYDKWEGEDYCGQHGCARVNPDGEQQNLNRRGSCGFVEKRRYEQLELFDEEESDDGFEWETTDPTDIYICWKCKHIYYDIGINKFICRKHDFKMNRGEEVSHVCNDFDQGFVYVH